MVKRRLLCLLASAPIALSVPVRAEESPQLGAPAPAVDAAAPAAPASTPPTEPSSASAAASPLEPVSVPANAPRPDLHHAPIATARANESLLVSATLVGRDLVRRAVVVYRESGSAGFRTAPLRRSESDEDVAEIPARFVTAPSLEYAIELELEDGRRVAAFASRRAPHRVAVAHDYLDLRERALLARVGGRRSLVALGGEYVSFGESRATVDATGEEIVSDRYYRVEAAYTYRLLRTVTEFSMRLGVLRGRSPATFAHVPGDLDVGLNYTAPSVLIRLHDAVHVEGEGLVSLTEEGFRIGGGGRVFVGDLYHSGLSVGFEGIADFGSRFWSRVDIAAGSRLVVSPIVEATDWPHADAYGVRLRLELGVDLGAGYGVNAGGGYEAREAASGGPSGTLTLMKAF